MDRLDSNGSDRQLSVMFVEKYLRPDGVFVLKLVAKNSTDLVVADIVAALWDNYRTKPDVVHHGGPAAGGALRARRRSAAPAPPGVQDDEDNLAADDGDKVWRRLSDDHVPDKMLSWSEIRIELNRTGGPRHISTARKSNQDLKFASERSIFGQQQKNKF